MKALMKVQRGDGFVELREVEHSLHVKQQKAEAGGDDYAYGMKEYDMTREELEAFEKRQDKINRDEHSKGLTTRFEGPFNPDFLD